MQVFHSACASLSIFCEAHGCGLSLYECFPQLRALSAEVKDLNARLEAKDKVCLILDLLVTETGKTLVVQCKFPCFF